MIGASPIELWAYGSAVGPVDLHFPLGKSPVAIASRATKPHETHYPQLDLEATAINYAPFIPSDIKFGLKN